MSYKITVGVARFTEADEKEFKEENPRATAIHMPPIVGTRAEARKEALKVATEQIADSEQVDSIRMMEETPAGWLFAATVGRK
jgi:hypothetical protein